jgi:hypothetical protein
MGDSLVFEYEQSLALLSGSAFQDEVTARLQAFINDFQPVPANPQGDAGADALSHRGEQAYCCYGLEHDQFKTNQQREAAIIEKFKSDLRRLLELEFVSKKLKHSDNTELATILPSGKKISHITLLPNWFKSHRILGPISTALLKYVETSQCRYVEKTVTVVVLGPRELANRYAVDEVTIARSRQRVLIKKVEEKAKSITLSGTEKFDQKMDDLKDIVGGSAEAISALKKELQVAWRKSLALEQELNDTLPNMHRELETNRAQILTRVSMLMVASDQPWKELERATEIASNLLRKDFDKIFGLLIEDLSSGEIARLIGECPVGWESSRPLTLPENSMRTDEGPINIGIRWKI